LIVTLYHQPKQSVQAGFTLIELMIVVAILAIIAAMAVPNLLSSKMAANDNSAIGSLRMLVTAQSVCQYQQAIDADADGAGEYGTLSEMGGSALLNLRGGNGFPGFLNPPIWPPTFSLIDANGRCQMSGYEFQLFLPDAAGLGVPEVANGGPDPAVDTDRAESLWSCYAWPMNPGISGGRAYYVDYRGQIFISSMDNVIYSSAVAPAFDAALLGPTMTSRPASSAAGQDTNTWRPLQ
jgi:prepilin-type N-terminal cleavage/methylation domain-containing protein